MSRIAKLVRRRPDPRSLVAGIFVPGRAAAKRTMAVLSVAVVCLVAPRSAGAEQIPSARAQVAALETAVASSAGHVRNLTLAYQQDSTTASALAEQVSADQAEVARLRGQTAATREALQEEAIIGYTGGAVNGVASGPVSTSGDPAVRAEYLQIAAGDISNTIDQYRTQVAQVGTAEANLTSQLRASEKAEQAVASVRQAALDEAESVQIQLNNAQVELQQLEAEAAAQAAAQAAAKAAAAQAQAAAQAAARAQQVQGLPVGNGLVSIVQTVVSPSTSAGSSGGVWLELRQCESGDNYQANTGNGFYGAYQFSQSTWTDLGFPGRPDLESPGMQDQAAQELQARSGWGQWPACSAALGLS